MCIELEILYSEVNILYPIIDILFIHFCDSDIYMISYLMKYKIAYILVNKTSEVKNQISYFTEGCKITQHAKI